MLNKAFDRAKEKTKKKAEEKINREVDKAIDPKAENNNKPGEEKVKDKSEQTIINEKDFVQNAGFPPIDPNSTRVGIAKNLVLDIEGKYPIGYKPRWRFITFKSDLDFDVENYVVKRSALGHGKRSIGFGDYNGKAVLRFGAFIGCDCYAEIVIKDSQNVLTETPQTFKVTNFQKIINEKLTGEKCRSSSNNMLTDGGWEGEVTLSANQNGDIKMDLMVENFRVASRFTEAGVSYRYIAKGITIENEMPASKAIAIIEAEKEAKQRQKDYISKTKKQADSLQKVLAKKYPQKDCRDCFSRNSNSNLQVTPTTTVYTNGYGDVVGTSSGSDWDINTKTEIKNKCGYDVAFIGIQQMYDEVKGYYLIEVNRVMEKGYNYKSDQGAMSSLFSSLIGGGSEFNIKVQDKYYPEYASVGAVQWIKVIRK